MATSGYRLFRSEGRLCAILTSSSNSSEPVDPKPVLSISEFPNAQEGEVVFSGEVGIALARIFAQNDTEFLHGQGKHDGKIFVFPQLTGHLVGEKINVTVRDGKLAFEKVG